MSSTLIRRAGSALMALGLAACVTPLGACGGNGQVQSEHRVPPTQWWSSVCRAVKPWSAEIQRLQSQAQHHITGKSDAQQTKTELVNLFGGMEKATDAAAGRVRKAGVPDVDDGQRVADQFVHALLGARDSFGAGRRTVQRLSTADRAAFYDGVVAAGKQMTSQNDRATRAFAGITSPELNKAFDEVPECR